MKEVCIINYASRAANYGIGTYIREYTHCLINIGYKVYLIELGTDLHKEEVYIKEKGNVKTIYIPYILKNLDAYNKSVCRLLRLYLKDSQNLVFHFQFPQSESLLPHIKKNFPLAKSILTVHYQYWSEKLNGDLSAYENIIRSSSKSVKKQNLDLLVSYQHEKKFMEAVDQVVCLAEDTYYLLNSLYKIDRNKLTLIPNGLTSRKITFTKEERDKIRESYHIRKDEKIVLFIGRIDIGKGLLPLLAAFKKVLNQWASCRLVLIGDGEVASLLQYSSEFATKITFTGKLNRKNIFQWYQMADIGVFPSFHEECSYVGIEMLMHGLPIVASDGYAVRNMFNKQNALIAHIDNYNEPKFFGTELSENILTLLKSSYLSEISKNQSLQTFKEVYHIKYMLQKYATMFAKL